VKKHLKGDDLAPRMSDLRAALGAVEPFDVQTTEQALRALAEAKGLAAGKYIHPLRVALLGVASSPPIFDVAVTLGKAKTLRRLDALLARLTSAPLSL
jgi:glutamyl-tRNA synthetase